MATWIVSARIEGTANVMIEADSMEEAIEQSKGADGWEIDDWELNTAEYRGGYIDAIGEDE